MWKYQCLKIKGCLVNSFWCNSLNFWKVLEKLYVRTISAGALFYLNHFEMIFIKIDGCIDILTCKKAQILIPTVNISPDDMPTQTH